MCKHSHAYFVAVVAVVIAAGCLDTGTVPTPSGTAQNVTTTGITDVPTPNGAAGFLPLEVGNEWAYQRTFDYVVIDENDNVIDQQSLTEDVLYDIIGTEERFGREYVLNQQTYVRESGDDLYWWDRYRQDRSGLYRADIALGEPPASPAIAREPSSALRVFLLMPKTLPRISEAGLDPNTMRAYQAAWSRLVEKRRMIETMLRGISPAGPPGGALSQETTTLRYPLRPGQKWEVRTDPFLVASQVEAAQVLDLPAGRFPGWRVRLDNSVLGPNDSVRFWYGHSGLLGERIHVESLATDLGGNVIGTMIADETLYLTSLDLVGPGHQP